MDGVKESNGRELYWYSGEILSPKVCIRFLLRYAILIVNSFERRVEMLQSEYVMQGDLGHD